MRKPNPIVKANTNQIVTAAVSDYVEQFNFFANKSAEAVLEMCQVVYQANRTLSKDEFIAFAGGINLKLTSSTVSKWKTIGENYARLIKHKEYLPCAWTTIYNITKLDDVRLEQGISDKHICETMNNIDLKKVDPALFPTKARRIVDSTAVTVARAVEIVCSIKAKVQLDSVKIAQMLADMANICSQYDCEVVTN